MISLVREGPGPGVPPLFSARHLCVSGHRATCISDSQASPSAPHRHSVSLDLIPTCPPIRLCKAGACISVHPHHSLLLWVWSPWLQIWSREDQWLVKIRWLGGAKPSLEHQSPASWEQSAWELQLMGGTREDLRIGSSGGCKFSPRRAAGLGAGPARVSDVTQEARDPNQAMEPNETRPGTDVHGLDASFGQ